MPAKVAFWGIVALFFCMPWLLTRGEPPALHQGQLLVATQKMPESLFSGSVLYLLRHDPAGAFGLVLNRPFPDGAYDGGPVDPGRITVLHTSDVMPEGSSRLPPPDDFLAVAEGKDARQAVERTGGPVPRFHRVFSGYAGWAPGQLDNEIKRGHWIVAPYDEDAVFGEGANSLFQKLIGVGNPGEGNLGP